MLLNDRGIYLFETPIGTCGIAWTPNGIDHVMLPGKDIQHTKRLLRDAAGKRPLRRNPPAAVREAAERIAKHLAGKPDPFDGIELDLSDAPAFAQKVYGALRRVPEGITLTYGDLARLAGKPSAARAVGRAMATNPVPILVPCHRVLPSTGGLGGFSAKGGVALKAHLLEIEGAGRASS